jgi:hypothetical protein
VFPALHGGHFDPSYATVFGSEFYKRRHADGVAKRVVLPGGATNASNPELDRLKDFIYNAIDNGVIGSQADQGGPWKHATTTLYDFSVHCMSCNTPPHSDNKNTQLLTM